MSQRRYWNFKDDDATNDINHWLLGILPYGLYYGYDAQYSDSLVFSMNHETTGQAEVDSSGAWTLKMGAVMTKQGVVIKEDGVISVGVSQGHPTYGRIDTIVVEHSYTFAEGGTAATYKVIAGSPAANPVPNALTDAVKQTIIGYLFVPAGMTSLINPAVTWTRAVTPSLGNDPTIVKTNNEQSITGRKQLYSIYGVFNTAAYQPSGNTLVLDRMGNYFILPNTNTSYLTIEAIEAIWALQATPIDILCLQRLRITGTAINRGSTEDFYVEAGEVLRLVNTSGLSGIGTFSWHIYGKDRTVSPRISGVNKQSKGTIQLNGGSLTFSDGNYFVMNVNNSQNLNFLPDMGAGMSGTKRGGTVVIIQVLVSGASGSTANLVNNAANIPAGYKRIATPSGANLPIRNGDMLMMVEDEADWKLVSVFGPNTNTYVLEQSISNLSTTLTNQINGVSNALNAYIASNNLAIADLNTRIDQLDLSGAKKYADYIMKGLVENDLASGVILSGGRTTITGATGGVPEFVVTEGVAYIDNEYRTFGTFSGVGQAYLKPVAGTETAEWVTSVPVGPHISYDPYTSQLLDDILRRRIHTRGTLIHSVVFGPFFDSTGLGKWSYKGFAIANGRNGTVNATGKVLGGFDDQNVLMNYNWRYIGSSFGAETVGLSITHLPQVDIYRSNSQFRGQSPGGSGNGNRQCFEDNSSLVTFRLLGGNQPHSNIQPTLVTVIIQRLD